MTNIASVVKLLQREHARLTKQIKGIAAALEAFGSAYGTRNGTRKISAADARESQRLREHDGQRLVIAVGHRSQHRKSGRCLRLPGSASPKHKKSAGLV